MQKLFREPLFHFLLFGALIFLIYSFLAPRTTEQGRIVITRGQIDALVTGFTRTWHRQPTEADLEALIRDHVREEVSSREAIELGLDKDDSIVKRRLMQKLEFINDAAATQDLPTDEELQQFLNDHQSKFITDQTISFSQIFLDPDKHRDDLETLSRSLRERLNAAGSRADISGLGDPFLLEQQFDNIPASELAITMGEGFVHRLSEVPIRAWTGPIESGYGQHIVFVSERRNGHLPPLADIRDSVLKQFLETRRVQIREQYFSDLLKRYDIVIEEPLPTSTQDPVGGIR